MVNAEGCGPSICGFDPHRSPHFKKENDLTVKVAKKLYHDQYCKKHDQWFMKSLPECPICVGERIGPAYVKQEETPMKPSCKEDKGV